MDLSRGRCLSIDDLQKSFARNQLCHRKGNQNGLLLNLRLTKSRNSLTKCANHGATKLIDAQHFSQLQSGIPLHNRIGYETDFGSPLIILFVEVAARRDLQVSNPEKIARRSHESSVSGPAADLKINWGIVGSRGCKYVW